MATSYKAIAMAHDIASELSQRKPGALTVAESFDTDANPLIKVGTGSIGAKGGLIKLMPIDWPLAKDVLGLTSAVYTPHKAMLAVEANYAGTSDNIADINTWDVLLPVIAVLVSRGVLVEVYEETNGTAPTVSTFAAAKLKGSFQASLQYPMVNSQ